MPDYGFSRRLDRVSSISAWQVGQIPWVIVGNTGATIGPSASIAASTRCQSSLTKTRWHRLHLQELPGASAMTAVGGSIQARTPRLSLRVALESEGNHWN